MSRLAVNYDKIYMQDEMIKSWHQGLFGKQVQNSALGAIKSRLKNLESVQIISRTFPTTKMCYQCGKINSLNLQDRIYKCSCGLEEDRDIKAAKTVMKAGKLNILRMEHTNTLLESQTPTKLDSDIKFSKLDLLKEADSVFRLS